MELPSDARRNPLEKVGQTLFSVAFRGTGYGASGTLDLNSNLLTIVEGGLGYGDNPSVEVLNESNQTVATLDPKWIRVKMGTDYDQTAVLRNLSEASPRGLRGIALPASQFGARDCRILVSTSMHTGLSIGPIYLHTGTFLKKDYGFPWEPTRMRVLRWMMHF